MINGNDEQNLEYLLDPCFQIVNTHGSPLTSGWLEVYIHGTRTKYYCASDFDGTLHPFKIPLDSLGSNIVLADPSQAYDVYVYNKYGVLKMSRYNVKPGSGGSGSGQIVIDDRPISRIQVVSDVLDGPDWVNKSWKYALFEVEGDKLAWRQDGDNINLGQVYAKAGVYHYDFNIKVDWTGELRNEIVRFQILGINANDRDIWISFDLSYPHTEFYHFSCIATRQEGYEDRKFADLDISPYGGAPEGLRASVETLTIYSLDDAKTIVKDGGSSGLDKVYHDQTMTGDGTFENPLSISTILGQLQDQIDGKQDELTPGTGISIINNVISCTASGTGPTYTAGQYIDITPENVINVSGLQPAGEYITPEDLNGYATTEDVERATSGKLDASAYRAPVNADWNSEGGLSEILNKPDVAGLIPGQGIEFTPSGDNYVINCTSSGDVSKQYVDQAILSATSGKLNASDYTAPEQSDWNEADAADLAYIKNKPVEIGFIAGDGIRFEDLSSAIKISCSAQGGSTYTPGTGIDITGDVISVNSAVAMKSDIPAAQVQSDWTEADTEDPAFIKNKPSEYELIAGPGVSITPSGTNYIISSTGGGGGGGSTYTAGDGIDITGDVISVTSAVAKKSDLATLATKTEVQAVAYQNKILTYGSSVTMSQLYEYLNLNPYLGQNLMVKITSTDLPTAIVNKLGGQSQPVFAHYTHATKVESSGGQVVCFEAPITVTNYTGSIQYPQSYIVQILAAEGSSYSDPVTWSVSYKELKADSDVFWVTLTYSSNTWTGDKTVAELQQAKDDGKLILLKYNEPGYYPSYNPPTPGYNSYGRVYVPSKWSGSNIYDSSNIFCAVYIGQNYIESSTYKPMIHILQANGNSSGNVTFRDILGAPMELAKASDLPDMSTYATQQYVQNETSAFITSGDLPSEEEVDFEELDLSTYATQTYVASEVSGKQDKLTFTYDANDDIIGINGSGIGGTGGGSSYTAGTGIDITNDVISIDPAVVPSKADLNGYVPYDASGVNLPNSHFEINTSGQAYKVGFGTKTDITSNDFYVGGNGIDLPYRGLAAGTYEFHITSEPAASYIKSTGLGDPLPGLTEGIPVINGVATWVLTENIPAGNRQQVGFFDSSDQAVDNAYSSTVWAVTPGTKTEYALKSDLPDTSTYATKSELQNYLPTSGYTAPVNSDWTAETGLAQILNKPDTEEMDVQELSAGPGISINNGVISVSGQYLTQADLAGYATQTWVGQQGFLESSDLNGYATQEWVGQQGFLTSIPSTYATDEEVVAATSGKQNKLSDITDVQLVNALPASPVAGVLYLIPEA